MIEIGRDGTTGIDFGQAIGVFPPSSRPVLRPVLGETARKQDYMFLSRPVRAVPPLQREGGGD